ncbi:MAG: hypothetical protein ACLRP8_03330 [Roseburia intestinalis]
MSFVGFIVGTQGEQVEVAFDIDKSAAGGNSYGFAPATGNLMYCMPQKGTKTALYIGNGDEAQGIATGCIRTNGSTCEGTGSPEKKSFRSEHGKGMDLYPQSMGLDGGETGKITFEDETGTTIESNGGLVLSGKRGNPVGEYDRDCHAGNVGYHGTVFRRSIQSLCEWQCGHAWHENRSGGNGISGV